MVSHPAAKVGKRRLKARFITSKNLLKTSKTVLKGLLQGFIGMTYRKLTWRFQQVTRTLAAMPHK